MGCVLAELIRQALEEERRREAQERDKRQPKAVTRPLAQSLADYFCCDIFVHAFTLWRTRTLHGNFGRGAITCRSFGLVHDDFCMGFYT